MHCTNYSIAKLPDLIAELLEVSNSLFQRIVSKGWESLHGPRPLILSLPSPHSSPTSSGASTQVSASAGRPSGCDRRTPRCSLAWRSIALKQEQKRSDFFLQRFAGRETIRKSRVDPKRSANRGSKISESNFLKSPPTSTCLLC